MNAKKIMGAVLVALLAAALFVGAGAAADAKSVGTVFIYQETGLKGTWTGDAGSVTFVNGVVAGENIKEGVYTNESGYSMYLSYPTAVITGLAANNSVQYSVVGGTLYTTADYLNLTAISPAAGNISDILITLPSGVPVLGSEFIGLSNVETAGSDWSKGILYLNITNDIIKKFGTGEFKLQAVFSTVVGGGNDASLVSYIPDKYLVAKDVYTITIVDEEKEVTLSASVDKVLAGNAFSITITGMPGKEYTIVAEDNAPFKIISAGANSIDKTQKKFNMPNGGSITVYMNSTAEDEITLKVGDAEVTIEILEPSLSATVDASSYFIGNKIEVTLTTDGEFADTYYFNITGTNFAEKDTNAQKKDGKKDVYVIETTNLGKVDVGTYTIKIYDSTKKTVLATLPVVLKQPFITIAEAPEVVVQGTKAEFIINAEAVAKTTGIQYYIFGTNYFVPGNTTTLVKDTTNQFIVTLSKENTSAKNMSTGQYFAVFQHPMYDGLFNINATKEGAVKLYPTTKAGILGSGSVLFNVSDRQTANAAQALCDALETQNIDDMYVKASFFVVGKDESFTISEIPTTIAQGETLTISGVSTANADGTVTVEMISTAFAAVPKETVGSAAFIAVSTKVAEDGTWEITMDTSDLNVDEYSLKVAVTPADGETETWKNVNINVVEADEPVNPEQPEEPEQPEQPEEPVAPATPGFGALAALAGLGAVAVLLLRRE